MQLFYVNKNILSLELIPIHC